MRSTLITFKAAALLCILAKTDARAAGADDLELAQIGARLKEMIQYISAPAHGGATPGVHPSDSVLFVYYDSGDDAFHLGRREAAQGDNQYGSVLARNVNLARPAITGDGSIALFINEDFDLCGLNTADPDARQCLGFAGRINSVAISPDARLAALVLRDVQTGEPDNKITLLDLAADKATIYNLAAPDAAGVSVEGMLHADSMTFTADNTRLIYDALSQLKFGDGPAVRRWSIYSLHLESRETSVLVPPQSGVNTANPVLGRASNRNLALDARVVASGTSSVLVLDISTGQAGVVATVPNGWGFPNFLGDESGLIYSAPDPNATMTGLSLFKQDLTADRLHTQGNATVWYEDADLGVVYRRRASDANNELPTVTLQISSDRVSAQGSVTLTATATDSDGTIARVEFYKGSTKLGQAETTPYKFVWENIPAGNHLLTARAIDNRGGTKDSSPRLLTASGSGGNALPTVTFQLSADNVSGNGSVTLTATATDSDGTIVRVEFYKGSTKLGQSETAPYKFVWENIPAGNHLLTARAIDNAGGAKDSSPRLLTVSGTSSPSGDKPKLSIRAIAGNSVRLTVNGQAGYYIIAMSEDLKNWVDIYPVTIGASGIGTVDDSGGPANYSRLFYRVRREQ